MTPTFIFATVGAALALVMLYAVRRMSRHSVRERDLGMVSTRWISELRRDEPWSRS